MNTLIPSYPGRPYISPLIHFYLLAALTLAVCQESRAEKNTHSHTFYKTYKVDVPADNFIVIGMRGFGPSDYLVLDMNKKNLRIYSPNEEDGLELRRELKKEEVASIIAIFESKEYTELANGNSTIALDGQEIDIISRIKKIDRHIHHTMSKDKTMKRIVKLYEELTIIPK